MRLNNWLQSPSITLLPSVPWASKGLQNGKPKVRISCPSEFLFLHLSLTSVSIPWGKRLRLTHVLSTVPGTVWNLTRHMLLEPRWVSVPPSGPLPESRNYVLFIFTSQHPACLLTLIEWNFPDSRTYRGDEWGLSKGPGLEPHLWPIYW